MPAQVNKKAQTYYVGNGTGAIRTKTNTEENPLSNINYVKKVEKLPSHSGKTKNGTLGNATTNTGG